MIGIVDYGTGNIHAFYKIYKQANYDVFLARTPEDLDKASKLILPGVGSFDWAMNKLNMSGMREKLDEMVLDRKIDVLGVCIGMQIMAQISDEGSLPGLSWIDAKVVKLISSSENQPLVIPHMGWNDISFDAGQPIFKKLIEPQFYFLHSYFIEATDPKVSIAKSSYGEEFTVAVRQGNLYGTQFHPEKSHGWGISLLQNFAEL